LDLGYDQEPRRWVVRVRVVRVRVKGFVGDRIRGDEKGFAGSC